MSTVGAPLNQKESLDVSSIVFLVVIIVTGILLSIFVALRLSKYSFPNINIAIYVTLAILVASSIGLFINGILYLALGYVDLSSASHRRRGRSGIIIGVGSVPGDPPNRAQEDNKDSDETY